MSERLATWVGPGVDADGVRVRWRTDRTALVLAVTAMMFTAATAVLAVLMITGVYEGSLWSVTVIASYVFVVAAHKRLRRTVKPATT